MSEQSPYESTDPRSGYTAPDPSADLRAGGIAGEVSRRVSSILDAVESEAARLRDEAREEARSYLDYSRRHADSLVEERRRRISELSDDILQKAEAVAARLEDAGPVREGFENLVRSLGEAAERLAWESERTSAAFQPPDFHDRGGYAQQQPPAPAGPGAEPPRYQPPQQPPSAPPQYHEPPTPAPAQQRYQQPAPPPEPSQYRQPPPAPYPPYAPHPPPPPERAVPPPPPRPAPGHDPSASQFASRPQPHPARTPERPGAASQGTGEADPADRLEDVRSLAIQMATAGSTRRQVGERLDRVIGLEDTRRVLDDVFGPGSAEDSRVPWSTLGG